MKIRKYASKLFSNKYFALLMCIVCMCFIFGRSMRNATASIVESGGITDKVISIWENLFKISIPDDDLFIKVIRKIAHFSEFFALGSLSFYARMTLTNDVFKGTGWSLLHGILTALCDETLQYFYDGRSPEVLDTWIDFSGFLFAYAVFCLIFFIVFKKRSRAKCTG